MPESHPWRVGDHVELKRGEIFDGLCQRGRRFSVPTGEASLEFWTWDVEGKNFKILKQLFVVVFIVSSTFQSNMKLKTKGTGF